MNRLEKRVEKLEKERGIGDERYLVWAEVPGDWPEERQKAEVTALVLERGVKEPFDMTLFPQQSPECRDIKLMFAGTQEQFAEILRPIMFGGKRTDR